MYRNIVNSEKVKKYCNFKNFSDPVETCYKESNLKGV